MKKQSITSAKLSLAKITITRLHDSSFLDKRSDFTDTQVFTSTAACTIIAII